MNTTDNYDESTLVRLIKEAEQKENEAKKEVSKYKNLLLVEMEDSINSALSEKEEPFGSITLSIGDEEVEFDRPKKVKYDQSILSNIYNQIIADGGKPSEYMNVEYSIEEKKYKAWPSNIKSYFMDSRTVSGGNVSIKIKEKK